MHTQGKETLVIQSLSLSLLSEDESAHDIEIGITFTVRFVGRTREDKAIGGASMISS